MSLLYNIGIALYECGITIASPWNTKAQQWREGRKGLLRKMERAIPAGERIVWIHAASLGEFEQGRPIIERLKSEAPERKILLTFFSPSGYEIRKEYPLADYIYYLPADRPRNVRRLLDIVKPEVAIFIKYEFWLNYLAELRRRGIATYLVSAIFRPQSIFFRSVGGAWREALRGYKCIFVQDEASKALLRTIGVEHVVVAGDTRFDRVREIAAQSERIPIVESFKGDDDLFVAGSTWERDEELLIELINSSPRTRFVIAPHEMEERRIAHLERSIKGGAVRYTTATLGDDFSNTQVLILDTIGMLSSTYAYARWAYIGGGFGAGIHNTLEAATFGLPIAFGTNYHKFQEAKDMIALGVATSVASAEELTTWFASLCNDRAHYNDLSNKARQYTQERCGATKRIVEEILG